jgi:epidermal growth factor receptor substrate 15
MFRTIVDTQGAGKLTMAQFMAAMFLISKIKFGQIQSVPTSVPPSVWTAFGNPTDNKRASTSMKPTTEIASPPKPQGHPILATLSSVPSNAEKAQYDQYFDTLDVGKKGFVTGGETYEFFLKSKLPEADLAKIWDLSDHLKAGKLNKEGFSVAMHLIKIRLAGNPLPTAGIAPPEPNFSASPMPASAIPAPSLNRAPTVISAASMPSPLLNRAPTVSSTSLLSDLMSFPTKRKI